MIKRIFIAFLIFHASAAFAETKLYLTGSANAGYAHNPDLRSLIDESEKNFNEDLMKNDKTQRKDANLQYGYSLEPRLFFNNTGIGIMIGKQYLSKAKISALSSDYGFWNESYKINATVFGFNLLKKYNISRNKRYWIIFGAGATYYRLTLDINYCDNHSLVSSFFDNKSLKTTGFGAQVKAELNFAINQRHDSLFIGIEGKKSIKLNFKGSYEDESGVIQEEELKVSFSGVTLYGGLSFGIF